ncbi:HEAT repeat domain-containing protein [Skeletonema marinoi]|uniref:HEAT repeat domain-containing protein n=4 Tax=Skeletonema marinoi TaxID=267567 RepID=A0AAD8YFP6_9STRA|nr:HEAT repeat domain-containing protein [Skeletonema marinoi]
MSSYYGQASSRSVWSEASGQQGQVYADPLNSNDEDYYYDANDQNRLDLLKLILYDLNSAIAPREVRLVAIQAALDEFDHDDEVLHDEELDLRADHILLQKLAYAMCIDPGSDEVGYICSALEMVYRAGRTRLAQSFHEICDSLLPLIVEMIRPPLPGKHSADKNRRGTVEEDLVSSPEEKPDLLDGENSLNNQPFMEPVDPLNASRRYTYGDSDDSSAESVQIPSGTGEYFEQMNRAKQDANNVAQTDQPEPQSHNDSQGLVLKPILSGEDTMVPVSNMGGNLSGGALEAYRPASNSRRRSLEIEEDTIRRDLTNADEALRRLTSESQELTQLVPAQNYGGGPMVAVTSSVGLPIASESRDTRLSGLTLESGMDEFKQQDEVMHLRGGGSGSVSSSDDASGNVGQNSRFNDLGDEVPLFDPTTMSLGSQSDAYGGSSLHGSFVYPESGDNPFSDENDYKHSAEEKGHEAMEEKEGGFDLGGGFTGDAPQIRPLGESVQVTDTYGSEYDEKEKGTYHPSSDEAKINVSDNEDYQNDMNNGAFDVGGGFTGDAPQIRPLGESVQVTDTYGSEYDEKEKGTYHPSSDEAKINVSDNEDYQNDMNNGAFDVGGGFTGDAPQIRPLGESVQVTDTYGSEYDEKEKGTYHPKIDVSDNEDYQNDMNDGAFDVGGDSMAVRPRLDRWANQFKLPTHTQSVMATRKIRTFLKSVNQNPPSKSGKAGVIQMLLITTITNVIQVYLMKIGRVEVNQR